MSKVSFKEFLELLSLGFCLGFVFSFILFDVLKINQDTVHTEKHGCEYVEKTECKQVRARK